MEILKATDLFDKARKLPAFRNYRGESRLLVTDEGTLVEHCELLQEEFIVDKITVYSATVPKNFLAEFGELIEQCGGLGKYDAYASLLFRSNKDDFTATIKSDNTDDIARHICVIGQYYGWQWLTSDVMQYGILDLRARWRLP